MFERFSHAARQVIIHAQEEARGLGHAHIGAEHILLGVVRVETAILPAGLDDIRARIGKRSGGWLGQIPFTPGAKGTLERAAREATALGHDHIAPAHLLLGLSEEPEAVLAAGATSQRIRAAAMRRLASSSPLVPPQSRPISPPLPDSPGHARRDLDAAIAAGDPVPVALGRDLIGDLGNPRTDARVLLAMLAKGGRSAALLREHGLDEAAVRGRLGP
ncbi:MAG: ATP-dependent Clp protease ATP-binding subunit ClpC [Solirubrobacteraceae bacterium]